MVNDAATMKHPSWCSPDHCTVTTGEGKVHRSRPARVRSRRTDLMITAQVLQDPDSDIPFVDLTIHFPDYGPDHPSEEYSFCFDSELAQAVGRILRITGRQAALPAG
jgi:hypothetical protein